jgi:hypothetical protein
VWFGRQTGLGVFISSRWGESWQCICVLKEEMEGRVAGVKKTAWCRPLLLLAPLVCATAGAACTAGETVREGADE